MKGTLGKNERYSGLLGGILQVDGTEPFASTGAVGALSSLVIQWEPVLPGSQALS